jgi:hypothetical protein
LLFPWISITTRARPGNLSIWSSSGGEDTDFVHP